jgi:hypothetical protein
VPSRFDLDVPHIQDRFADMLRLNQSIRLTARDVDRWIKLTGFVPRDIRCLAQLDAYIVQCKAYYWGTSRETLYLHWLMDRERALQLGSAPDELPPPRFPLGPANAPGLTKTMGENP